MRRGWLLLLDKIRMLGNCREFVFPMFCLVRIRLIVVAFSMLVSFRNVYVALMESIEAVVKRLVGCFAYSRPFVVTNFLEVPGCG